MVWRCGDRVVVSSSKYHLKQKGTIVELVIYKLEGADSGEYSCDTGSQRTSAVLTVQGRNCLFKTVLFIHSPESSACPHSNTWAWRASTFHLEILLAVFLAAFKCFSIISHSTCVLALRFTVFKALDVIPTNTFLLSLITDLISHLCLSLVSLHKH